MAKTPTLYIVDGSGYIFRAYYAIRTLSNSKGLPTNAVYGFTQMLLRLIKDEKPEHLVMVFDSKERNFRKERYPEYKANREAPPEDLAPQFDYIRKVTRALNIPVLAKPGFEADDIIATLVRRYLPNDTNAVIVTGDKDLMQLVTPEVSLLDTMKGKLTEISGVQEKFGVLPEQVVDVQALAGDSSDNVPGVPGVGPKTAGQLIGQYGSLDEVYKNLDELKGKKRENLENFKDQAYLSQWLVRLCDEVPLDFAFEQSTLREPDAEACQEVFQELEFQRLLDEFGGATERLSRDGYHLVQNEDELQKLSRQLKQAKCFAFDTETTSLEVRQAELVGLSFAMAAGEAYYIPLGHAGEEKQLPLSVVISALKPIFMDPGIKKVAQNFKYDAAILKNYAIDVAGLSCDTLLASYLLDPAGSHKLDALSLKFLNHKMISFQEVTGKKKGGLFSEVSIEAAKDYSCEDADVTFQLGEIFGERLREEKLTSILSDIEQPLSEVLLGMEAVGVKVDIPFLKKLQQEFSEGIQVKEALIYEIAGEEFNIQSPKQLGKILFDKLELPPLKKTKTGYSTDVGVLTELSESHVLPKEILAYRSLAKLKSTYVDALLGLADPKSDRVHTHFNQTIAETGRLSSTDPNLQNIPIRSEDGAKIRHAFIAESGSFLLSADYSQIELRVLAHFSEDKVLLDAFAKEEDIHRLSAAGIFKVSEAEVTAEMRAAGKTLNFAVVYGQTPFGLSKQLKITQKEAKQYIDHYFEKYQGVKTFRDQILADARINGEVRTLMGRRRFVADIESKNFNVRSFAERIAFNTVIQGTAADIIKKAMIDLDRQLQQQQLSSKLLLQVHDELVLEVPAEELETVTALVRKCMEQAVKFRVPLKVEIGTGKSWAEAH